jgi:hypothetical protein
MAVLNETIFSLFLSNFIPEGLLVLSKKSKSKKTHANPARTGLVCF